MRRIGKTPANQLGYTKRCQVGSVWGTFQAFKDILPREGFSLSKVWMDTCRCFMKNNPDCPQITSTQGAFLPKLLGCHIHCSTNVSWVPCN